MKFLNTTGLNYYLENLLKNAKKKIVLITPYIKLHDKIKIILKQQKSNGVEITIVFKEAKNIKSLSEYANNLYVHKNLHAKCYFNESEAILTSLNLYEFSQINNREMGTYVSTQNMSHNELYNEMIREVETIIEESSPHTDEKYLASASISGIPIIIEVEIVKGKTLSKYWKDDMQVVKTTKGEFIAELPNKRNKTGYAWKQKINQELKKHDYRIEHHDGYNWLYKSFKS